jgi:two-component system alkaline phosphatase synthesis response regulator PhoP
MTMKPVEKHILIVDDYVDALDIWAIYLKSSGYRVSTATDGASAIAKAQQLLPDLVVLDLELPGISGFEVARTLRANPETADIPLIAATGYSHLRQLDLAREVGFDAVVVKPCNPDLLLAEIERLIADPIERIQLSSNSMNERHKNG